MLSPAIHHQIVPKELIKNIRFRQSLLKQARERPAQIALRKACRDDVLFWINSFVLQYNPLHLDGEYGPFITWDFQDEAVPKLIWAIENQRPIVIEKSREMGGTYLCLLVCLWLCLFHENKKVLVISRDADAVDKPGEPDCIFWKIDQVLESLPGWMKGRVKRRKMSFNFANGSKITGTSSTSKAGVGGRAAVIFLDEFSQVEEDREMRTRTASTGNCRFFNGTHLGVSTEFYNLCQQPEIAKIQMHWTQHPEKIHGLYEFDPLRPTQPIIHDKDFTYPANYRFVLDGSPTGGPRPGVRSPWYDQKCLDIGSAVGVAQDLDINPSGSVSQFFDALVIRDRLFNDVRDPYWEGNIKYDLDTGRPIGLEKRKGGPLKLWCILRNDVPPRSQYGAGADISRGLGTTNSCLTITAGTTGDNVAAGDMVAEYVNPTIRPDDFALVSVALCWLFQDRDNTPARLCWEMQGPGMDYGLRILQTEFRNVYYRNDDLKPFEVEKATTPGFYPTPKAVLLLMQQYEKALRERQMVNRSEFSLKECLLFQQSPDGTKVFHSGVLKEEDPSGSGVNHGDRVVAAALSWKMAREFVVVQKKVEKEEVPYNSLLYRRQLKDMLTTTEDSWSEAG